MLTPVSGTGQALPHSIISLLQPFSTLFRQRTWMKAQVLLLGVLLPRKRTITSALSSVGPGDEAGYAKYHHVLSRAAWSPLQLRRVLLISHLGREDEPLVFGIDETPEQLWGSRISAEGICRNQSHPAQSTHPQWELSVVVQSECSSHARLAATEASALP